MRAAFIFLFIVGLAVVTRAQTNSFSGQLNNEPFQKLVDLVESNSDYRFFYLKEWVDTLRVSTAFSNATIDEALTAALKNSSINYYRLDKKIILIKNDFIIDQVNPLLFSDKKAEEKPKPNYYFQKELVTNPSGKDTVIQIGTKESLASARSYELSGQVREANGKILVGALILLEGTNVGATSDSSGRYHLQLKPGFYNLLVQYTGMGRQKKKLIIHSSGRLDFVLSEYQTTLREVTVEASGNASLPISQIGSAKIDMQTMKNIPKVLGENDLVKIALTMPGIKTIGEGSAGIYVRGGNADQNLILLNEATIYNPMHLLGFFSIFNASAIKSSEVYKSSIPVQYGGRLSSVFDLQMREGSDKKIEGSGGIGPITSHLSLEGPLLNKKITFLTGGRLTYSNWILNALPSSSIKNSQASFNDFFLKIGFRPGKSDFYQFTIYSSSDRFKLSFDSLFSYQNLIGIFQWKHVFRENLHSTMTFSQSRYDYSLDYLKDPKNSFNLGLSTREDHFKYDVSYQKGAHKFDFGVQSKLYNLDPGFIRGASAESVVLSKNVQHEKGWENALYLADNFELSPKINLYFGLRYSLFTSLGPGTVYRYDPNQPKSDDSITDTLKYNNNANIATYQGPEFRISSLYRISNSLSLKLSYGRTRQYMHMLSNTVSVTPINTWKLSQPGVLPQIADQISLGLYKDILNKGIELSLEGYYKDIQNILDYKTGATLVLNANIEKDILQGSGKAYGVEFLLRKKSGRLNGWVGYSYSRTFIKLDSRFPQERVNNGAYYPASYDKPNDVNVVANYRITRRYSFSLNFVYSTGRPITFPSGVYYFDGAYRINYSDRNQFRIPDYVRFDIGFNIEGNHRIKKLAHGFWTISIYNVLGRKNPYSIYFTAKDGNISAYSLSIFGSPVPTITYNFKF